MNLRNQTCTTPYRLSVEGPSFRLSDHFILLEAASRDGFDLVLVAPALVEGLEAIRARFGVPVHVNSWFRSPSHNARIGGSADSQHVRGLAADIVVRGVPAADVATVAEEMNFGGVGRYPDHGFTHVDVGPHGRRWRG